MDKFSEKKQSKKRYYSGKMVVRGGHLQAGMKGFLCTFNGMEIESVKETYKILNKTKELLSTNEEEINKDEESIEDELQGEISSLKTKEQLFNRIDVGAKNVFFVHCKDSDPLSLGYSLGENIQNGLLRQTRFVKRVIPTQTVCKANLSSIKEAVEPLLKEFLVPQMSFSIDFTHRNNDTVKQKSVIDEIIPLIDCNVHKVDLKNADVSIVIDLIKSFAFVSVIKDYHKLKKFNLSNLDIKGKAENKE